MPKTYEITPGLYIGTVETRAFTLTDLGFDVVVDCIDDVGNLYPVYCEPYKIYITCPFEDTADKLPDNLNDLVKLAKIITLFFMEKRTLIRCWGGRNRSAFLTGLVLLEYGFTDVVNMIISKRHDPEGPHPTNPPLSVLHNAAFRDYLLGKEEEAKQLYSEVADGMG